MRDVYESALTNNSPTVDAEPDTLKVTLRAHQQAALYAMESYERTLLSGMKCKNEVFYSNYGILGDSVGVGKSLMVLGHIGRLSSIPPLESFTTVRSNSSQNVFSIQSKKFNDASEANCLIIVPHTLFRQWADYIKKQTNLSCMLLDKAKTLVEENFQRDILSAQVVLISNTLYREYCSLHSYKNITWKRLFVDEGDTIHMKNRYPWPQARFTWFITASWMNMLFPNESLHIYKTALQSLVFEKDAEYSMLKPYFKQYENSNAHYHNLSHSMTSYNYFREHINNSHPLRGKLVLHCSEEFIQQSISLPTLYRQNILCRAPITQQIVSQAIPSEVQNLLHGGDISGAIAALGVKVEDTTSLIEAVTKNLTKELTRLKATHAFKASLEYSTPQAKEVALKTLEEKIKRTEDSIKAIQDRIEGFKEEVCPICYDEPQSACLTPCCSRVFCAQCILTCITRQSSCPMCRAGIHPKELTQVISKEEKNKIVASGEGSKKDSDPLEKKSDTLIRIFKENPQGRFLVFSRYDNPFSALESHLDSLGIRVKQLKGNKDAVASTLRAFQAHELRCLLLNSHYAGSGLNITAATHVILLHAMTHEEEKQILGRAYRMGRTEPLHFIRLLHKDEMQNQD